MVPALSGGRRGGVAGLRRVGCLREGDGAGGGGGSGGGHVAVSRGGAVRGVLCVSGGCLAWSLWRWRRSDPRRYDFAPR